MFGCLSVSFRTIKERKNTFVSYHLFTMCKFQFITTNKNMKNDKLPRMITTKTRIRLYRRTIGCLSLSSQQTVSGHYRPASETALKCCFAGGPIVARLKKTFAYKDSDQTAQSDARFYPASTWCRTTIGLPAKRHSNVVSLAGQ